MSVRVLDTATLEIAAKQYAAWFLADKAEIIGGKPRHDRAWVMAQAVVAGEKIAAAVDAIVARMTQALSATSALPQRITQAVPLVRQRIRATSLRPRIATSTRAANKQAGTERPAVLERTRQATPAARRMKRNGSGNRPRVTSHTRN